MNEADAKPKSNASDHLANERTFLAWIRTGIGIMAFGFVVVKFSLFMKQLAVILGSGPAIQPKGYSSVTGIILVVFGMATIVFAYTRYRNTEKQLDMGEYRQSGFLIPFVTFVIFSIGLFLIVYLISSVW